MAACGTIDASDAYADPAYAVGTNQMKLIRSDSPEVAHSVASTEALACWGWSVLTLVSIASAPGLLIVLIAIWTVSVRAGVWLGVPVFLALNAYLLWSGRSRRLNWVIACCTDRVFVRLLFGEGIGLKLRSLM